MKEAEVYVAYVPGARQSQRRGRGVQEGEEIEDEVKIQVTNK